LPILKRSFRSLAFADFVFFAINKTVITGATMFLMSYRADDGNDETFDVFTTSIFKLNAIFATMNWLVTPSASCIDGGSLRPASKFK